MARQAGYGIEPVRSCVRQADSDDGLARGMSTTESQRINDLEQQSRELKRAKEILKRAASFFGRISTTNTRSSHHHRREPRRVRGRARRRT
jgi:transposase